MSTEVMIELDSPGPTSDTSRRPPAHRYRVLGSALTVLLLLLLAGAAPAVTPSWHSSGLVAAVPADTVMEVTGARLYISVGQHGRRVTSAYATRPLRQLWTADTLDDPDAPPQLQAVQGQVIVQVGKYTDVLDARTGKLRWASPANVQPLPGGRTGLVTRPEFRPGSEYDESSGDPGILYFSPDGTSHTRPPERTELRGVDLATGRQRWSTSLPGAVYAAPTTGRPAGLVVVSSGRLDLLDADTGAVRRQRDLPASRGRVAAWSEIVGDLVLINSAGSDGDTVSAYGVDDLEPRWQRAVPVESGNSRSCTGLLCERRPSTLAVLDPRTGAASWQTKGSVDLVAWGRSAIEVEGSGSDPQPLRTVNPATGAAQTDLSEWQAYATGPRDSPLVLSRTDFTSGTTFGVLLPGQRMVRELGHSDALVISCQSTTGVVACRSERGIEVFTFRA